MAKRSGKKIFKVIIITIATLIVVSGIILFLCKGWLLEMAVKKIQAKLKNSYHLTLNIQKYQLDGISKLEMHGVECINAGNKTIASFNDLSVEIRLLPILAGRLRFKDLIAKDGMMDVNELLKLKKGNVLPPATDSSKFNKIKKYVNALERTAAMMPLHFSLTNIYANFTDSGQHIHAGINSLTYADNKVNGDFILQQDNKQQHWHTSGTFDKSSMETHISVNTDDTSFINLKVIERIAKVDFRFRKITIDIDKFSNGDDNIDISGNMQSEMFSVRSPKFSTDTVTVRNGGLQFKTHIDRDYINLDSSSVITLNDLKATCGISFKHSFPKKLSANMNMPRTKAQVFINSLPEGIFRSEKGMLMDGEFAYKLHGYLGVQKLDSVYFNSDLDGFGLKILSYGDANISKLNTSFTYQPYNSPRKIIIGPENPMFTPLNDIPPLLRTSIDISEDGGFYQHHGFQEGSFEEAILTDLKTKKFEHGASTISMQLVKNVFLSHQKNIGRKLDEALLVWLMENMHIVSKNKIFEDYLNIIEWGPGVYGIGEASRFYFNKVPSKLTLSECIFLSIIIPSPRAYKSYFDDQGHLKPYANADYHLVATRLALRHIIRDGQRDSLVADVKLEGEAYKFLKIKQPTDTIPVDTADNILDWNKIIK